MKGKLIMYFIYGIMDSIVLMLSIKWLIISVMDVDYIGVFIWALLISFNLDNMIDKHRNFKKYYPYFEDKWLQLF